MRSRFGFGAMLLVVVVLLLAAAIAYGQAAPPSFSVRFIGAGAVTAINDQGTLVGYQTHPTNYGKSPVVSTYGGPWSALPLPSGAVAGFATDVNDEDVIVGVADMPAGRRAVRWTPNGGGYTVDVLPLLPGELASYGTGINNLGQIVGARAGILGTPYGFGWMYSDAGGLVDLNARYGWFATPDDINDGGVILAGTQTFDLATATVSNVGLTGPSNYNAVVGVDINESGAIIGSASLRSSSLNIVSVFRYVPGAGWQFVSGTSRYAVANDINDRGDVGWGELGAGVLLDGLGGYALGSLLDPATSGAGWTITGNGCLLNDHRVVATIGRNAITGQTGVVLLTPDGFLPPPAAPTGLTATPHPATQAQPYVSIDLAWTNGDVALTRSYELERRISGQSAWTPIPLVPPAMSTFHQDTTVAVATTYDYRVRAVGVSGPGPWSATATATSPTDPLDTTRPVVTVLSPANGATVSGIAPVSAQASDNVGVAYLEISFWNHFLGQKVILGSTLDSGSLTVQWDSRGLNPSTYTVWALASDRMGNWTQAEIAVNVTAPPTPMQVGGISLFASNLGGAVSVTGDVYVRRTSPSTAFAPLANADVTARWTLPDGRTKTSTLRTDRLGRARFTASGGRGTYTLTVTAVTKQGYVFDPAGSVLTKSITK